MKKLINNDYNNYCTVYSDNIVQFNVNNCNSQYNLFDELSVRLLFLLYAYSQKKKSKTIYFIIVRQ
jgi:hypothetical protein